MAGAHGGAIKLGNGSWHCFTFEGVPERGEPLASSDVEAAQWCTGLNVLAVDGERVTLRIPEEPPGYVSPLERAKALRKLLLGG